MERRKIPNRGPGRPPGARNKNKQFLESLFENQAEELIQKAVDLALDGSIPALKMCLERILAVKKSRTVTLDLPTVDLSNASDLPKALLSQCSKGNIPIAEAAQLASIISSIQKAEQLERVDERLRDIESQLG